MWGYTARECAFASVVDHGAGSPNRCLGQRLRGPDLDAYGKTFLYGEGVHTRLYAQAFVLDDGERAIALVLADLGGIPGELHRAVAERLAAANVPIPAERLLIGATHTHGGPGGIFQYQGYAMLGGDAFDPRVFALVADQVAKAVAQAHAERVPATVAIGAVDVPDGNHNRAIGAHLAGHAHDHRHVKSLARVIRVDAADGRPLGAITNFAAHGTIVDHTDLLMTGDNQGVAARLVARGIAEASGLGEHDVVVTYLNGAQGDVSASASGRNFFEAVENSGRRQAGPILKEWAALEGKGSSRVVVDGRLSLLCFCGQEVEGGERISPIPILGEGDHRTMAPPLQVPGHGGKVPKLVAGPGSVPTVVRLQALRIGDHVMVGVPGEPSVALGEEIERAVANLPGVRTVDVVGLASDYVSYMSTLPEYDYQDYEGSFNLYGRMTGPLFRRNLVALSAALLAGEPAPPDDPFPLVAPDAPGPGVPTVTLSPASPPRPLQEPLPEVRRGASATFAWAGGAPAVDHPVDKVMVRVLNVATGRVVADDRGFEIPVRYEKAGADLHRWSAEWRIGAEAPPGEYEFRVMGRTVPTGGAAAEAYAFASVKFRVVG